MGMISEAHRIVQKIAYSLEQLERYQNKCKHKRAYKFEGNSDTTIYLCPTCYLKFETKPSGIEKQLDIIKKAESISDAKRDEKPIIFKWKGTGLTKEDAVSEEAPHE